MVTHMEIDSMMFAADTRVKFYLKYMGLIL